MLDKTMIFSLGEEKDDQIKAGLTIVYDALRQRVITPSIRLWVIFSVRILLTSQPTTMPEILSAK